VKAFGARFAGHYFAFRSWASLPFPLEKALSSLSSHLALTRLLSVGVGAPCQRLPSVSSLPSILLCSFLRPLEFLPGLFFHRGHQLGPISRMEARQPLAAMRLRDLLRRSITALGSFFCESSPQKPSGRRNTASDRCQAAQDEDCAKLTIVSLKKDYHTLLNESNNYLDSLVDVLTGRLFLFPSF